MMQKPCQKGNMKIKFRSYETGKNIKYSSIIPPEEYENIYMHLIILL
jgi:hypothetical protein